MTEKLAVHLPTQEAYDRYMQWAEKKGRRRCDEEEPTDQNVWGLHGDNDFCVELGDCFSWCDKSYYEKKGYRIITVEEAMQEEQSTTPEFVRGEEVEWGKDIGYSAKRGEVGGIDKFIIDFMQLVYDVEKIKEEIESIRKLPQQEVGPRKFTREQIYLAYTNARKGNVRSLDDILDGILSELDMLEK